MTSEVTEGLSGIRMARTYRLEEPLAENADGGVRAAVRAARSGRTAGRPGSRR